MASAVEAMIRQLKDAAINLGRRVGVIEQAVMALNARPRTITEEIDAIPGRRIETTLVGEVDFDINNVGQRGQPVTIQVSQDGPFVWTHYPMVSWYPNNPSNAETFGQWSPVSSWPLPTQVVTAGSIINLAYEIVDGGNQRQFQNGPRGPIFSRPDNLVPCPVPTLFAPNAAIQFYPTYLAIDFNGNPAVTGGRLHVDFIGYRIVNL